MNFMDERHGCFQTEHVYDSICLSTSAKKPLVTSTITGFVMYTIVENEDRVVKDGVDVSFDATVVSQDAQFKQKRAPSDNRRAQQRIPAWNGARLPAWAEQNIHDWAEDTPCIYNMYNLAMYDDRVHDKLPDRRETAQMVWKIDAIMAEIENIRMDSSGLSSATKFARIGTLVRRGIDLYSRIPFKIVERSDK